MEGEFQRNSMGWQLLLLQKRVGEWFESLFPASQPGQESPWSLPDWLARLFFWIVVIALSLWLLWQLYQLLRPYLNRGAVQTLAPKSEPSTNLKLTVNQWLGRSRTLAQRHNYREACRALYMALLQHLDDTQRLPQAASRTDGEYLQLLQTQPNLQPYQVLLDTHERLCFSSTEISAELFEHCQQAAQEVIQP